MRSSLGSPVWRSILAVVAFTAGTVALFAAPPPAAADGNEAPAALAAFRLVSAGGSHTCAVFPSGAVKCWGDNEFGQLGLGDQVDRGDDAAEMGDALPVVDLGNGRAATAITAGYRHTCAVLDNGEVKCWGAGANGRLGLGDSANRGELPGEMGGALPAVDLGAGRTATAISAGGSHTCALLDNGSVKCWGANSYGQLGLGDTQDRGDDAAEMGDALPAVSLGTGRTAVAITASNGHTCARLDNGSVKCWGSGVNGRLGTGATDSRGDQPGEMGDALAALDLGTGRTSLAISAGGQHTCALLDNGSVKCWGSGLSGRLGTGATDSRGDQPGEMGDSLPAVPLGDSRTATSVSAGYGHTCVRLDDATVKCWGLNGGGQLGQGSTAARGDGPNELGNALPPVSLGTGRSATAITTGDQHTCARLDDGTLKCWGDNVSGQLGLGDQADRGDQPGEMGDSLPAIDLGTGLVVLLRPDALIRRVGSSAAFVGDGIYNGTAEDQTVSAPVSRPGSVTFTVKFQNDGNRLDDLIVRGPGSTAGFKVKYLYAGSTDVTASVIAGTYRFDDVPPGAARRLQMIVGARPPSRVGDSVALRVKVRSTVDNSARDVVRADVRRV